MTPEFHFLSFFFFRIIQTEGENVNKLEKADVLEMTVRYIKRITRMTDPIQEAHRFHVSTLLFLFFLLNVFPYVCFNLNFRSFAFRPASANALAKRVNFSAHYQA